MRCRAPYLKLLFITLLFFSRPLTAGLRTLNIENHAGSVLPAASSAGASQVYFNPAAGSYFFTAPYLYGGSATYQQVLPDITLNHINFLANTVYGSAHAGIAYLDVAGLSLVDESGNAAGGLNVSDFIFYTGYSRETVYGIHGGVNLKYMHSRLASFSADTLSLDISAVKGFNYRSHIFHGNVSVRNLGTPARYADASENLPVESLIGFDYIPPLQKLPYRFLSDLQVKPGLNLVLNTEQSGIMPFIRFQYLHQSITAETGFGYSTATDSGRLRADASFTLQQNSFMYDLSFAALPAGDLGFRYLVSLGATRIVDQPPEQKEMLEPEYLSDTEKADLLNEYAQRRMVEESGAPAVEPRDRPFTTEALIAEAHYDLKKNLTAENGRFLYLRPLNIVFYIENYGPQKPHKVETTEGSVFTGTITDADSEKISMQTPAGELSIPYEYMTSVHDTALGIQKSINPDSAEKNNSDSR